MPDDVAVAARWATTDDVPAIVGLYRLLQDEQEALKDMWPLADGLPEPIEEAVADAIADQRSLVVIGELEGMPCGFALARIEALLPQANGLEVGSIRLIFTDHPAREVGVGEAMIGFVLDELRAMGLSRFDAHVLPGHRLAKNFFEAAGFAARSIVMHHKDDDTPAR